MSISQCVHPLNEALTKAVVHSALQPCICEYAAVDVQVTGTFCFDISRDFDIYKSTRKGENRQTQTEQAGSTLGLGIYLSLRAMAYGHSSGLPPWEAPVMIGEERNLFFSMLQLYAYVDICMYSSKKLFQLLVHM